MPPLNTNRILSKIVQFTDDITAHSARRYKSDLDALRRSKHIGPAGVPNSTINRLEGMSNAARSRSTEMRLRTALVGGTAGTAGYLGLHKYHQHVDNKIMARIDNMYKNDYNQ